MNPQLSALEVCRRFVASRLNASVEAACDNFNPSMPQTVASFASPPRTPHNTTVSEARQMRQACDRCDKPSESCRTPCDNRATTPKSQPERSPRDDHTPDLMHATSGRPTDPTRHDRPTTHQHPSQTSAANGGCQETVAGPPPPTQISATQQAEWPPYGREGAWCDHGVPGAMPQPY